MAACASPSSRRAGPRPASWATGTRQTLIDNEAPEFGVVNLQGSENIGSSTGGWTLMITKDAADPDLAWQAMEGTFGNAEVVASLTTLMPATKAANDLVLTDAFYDPFKEVCRRTRAPDLAECGAAGNGRDRAHGESGGDPGREIRRAGRHGHRHAVHRGDRELRVASAA